MRVGYSSIYSWRPHVEHLQFLATLSRQSGHEAFYLTCDADFPTCYARELRPERSAWMNCARCRIGGVRSYADHNVSSIGSLVSGGDSSSFDAYSWAVSSASTLGRFESDTDFTTDAFRLLATRLEPVARASYIAARRWIEKEKLDAICVFNGRMDATRGILEAARTAGIRCISVERTWFGDGLHLTADESCLGLHEVSRLVENWRDKPLSEAQALRAVSHIALRFLRRNTKEWRAYNTDATRNTWPSSGGARRILLTPGSRNEVWSHPDWESSWSERTAAFDAIIDHLNLRPDDLVLRCHPNWGEKIGSELGQLSEIYYTSWAKSRGICTIPSRDPTSTLGLIEQADAIVVCGGSAALEAGIIGKQVIATSPSVYQSAGFESPVYSSDQLGTLALHVDENESSRACTAVRISKLALRFAYTMVYRVAQYVDFVRCVNTTHYRYLQGANPQRFVDLIHSGVLTADDTMLEVSDSGEQLILELIKARAWDRLATSYDPLADRPRLRVQRRWMYRPVDRLRAVWPRGDL
jgi:hypothetical protein